MTVTQPMTLSNSFQARGVRTGVLIVAVAVTAGLFLTWVMLRRQPTSLGPAPAATSKAVVPSSATQNQTPTISSTITANGFSPAQATCSPGKVLLVISNQSGSGNLVLRLTRANGQPVAEFGLASTTSELRQEVSLDAGVYTLKETNHSSWALQITSQ